jgi:hypothetical protein
MPASAAAYCRERLIRLKPELLIINIRIKNANFIGRLGANP